MPKRVRLGIWTVDFAARQLSSGFVRATVSCRAIDVLRDLVAAGTATLSREALLDSVWADVIVTDESLTKAISELRRVFRRAEQGSDIIETVPRTGYRLLVERAEVETGVPPPVPAGLLSLEAYALVLEAEMALIRGASGAIADAVACSVEALRIAPDSAAANSAHAHALTVRALYGSGGPDDLRQALHCAERAVSLEPSASEGHAALGYALNAQPEFRHAGDRFAQCLSLGDMSGECHYLAARSAFGAGNHRMAFVLALRAAELTPDPSRPLFLAARAARPFDRETSKRTARRCVAALRQKLAGDPEDVRSLYSLGPALALAGQHDASWQSMATLPGTETLCAIHLVFGYGALGETSMALGALERAVDEGYRDRTWLFQEDTLGGLRRERRFQQLSDQLATA
ncbi:MAG: winged helix-turn-helix domain-containing protein [Pseudomonadota bacterium]